MSFCPTPVHEQRCGDEIRSEILRSFWEGEKTEIDWWPKKIGAMNHLKWFPTKNRPVFQGITSNHPRLVEMIQ